MDRDMLLGELRKRLENNNIELTSKIDFNYDKTNKCLQMNLGEGISENMQKDSAAFEGWALALKANLPDMIEFIKLSWDEKEQPTNKNSNGWKHFNRFLYRLDGFLKRYHEWFSVENEMNWEEQSRKEKWETLVINRPGQRKEESNFEKMDLKNEHDIETYFTSNNKLINAVYEKFHIKIDKINNQFPVGVFANEVKNDNKIFTGRKSAIDLYGKGNDGSFNIFELKAKNNVQIGIISELFFYALVVRDVVDEFIMSDYHDLKGINKINAYFLVTRLHPLITEEVFDLLNIEKEKIEFRKLLYSIGDNKIF